jgi:hypothetical protein
MNVQLKPIPLRLANDYVTAQGAQPGRVRGCKFSIGAYAGEALVGVVIVERPKARHLDDGWSLELTRVCTADRPTAASVLIDAATRAAFAMGARYVLSYTTHPADGAAFATAGWCRMEAGGAPIEVGGGEWSRPSRPRDPTAGASERKHRWERYVSASDRPPIAEAA